jgi:hypothetical protein
VFEAEHDYIAWECFLGSSGLNGVVGQPDPDVTRWLFTMTFALCRRIAGKRGGPVRREGADELAGAVCQELSRMRIVRHEQGRRGYDPLSGYSLKAYVAGVASRQWNRLEQELRRDAHAHARLERDPKGAAISAWDVGGGSSKAAESGSGDLAAVLQKIDRSELPRAPRRALAVITDAARELGIDIDVISGLVDDAHVSAAEARALILAVDRMSDVGEIDTRLLALGLFGHEGADDRTVRRRLQSIRVRLWCAKEVEAMDSRDPAPHVERLVAVAALEPPHEGCAGQGPLLVGPEGWFRSVSVRRGLLRSGGAVYGVHARYNDALTNFWAGMCLRGWLVTEALESIADHDGIARWQLSRRPRAWDGRLREAVDNGFASAADALAALGAVPTYRKSSSASASRAAMGGCTYLVRLQDPVRLLRVRKQLLKLGADIRRTSRLPLPRLRAAARVLCAFEGGRALLLALRDAARQHEDVLDAETRAWWLYNGRTSERALGSLLRHASKADAELWLAEELYATAGRPSGSDLAELVLLMGEAT